MVAPRSPVAHWGVSGRTQSHCFRQGTAHQDGYHHSAFLYVLPHPVWTYTNEVIGKQLFLQVCFCKVAIVEKKLDCLHPLGGPCGSMAIQLRASSYMLVGVVRIHLLPSFKSICQNLSVFRLFLWAAAICSICHVPSPPSVPARP